MYADLPDSVKRRVLERLAANDFRAAKQIHDHWFAHQQLAPACHNTRVLYANHADRL
jgi:hypothetical protein